MTQAWRDRCMHVHKSRHHVCKHTHTHTFTDVLRSTQMHSHIYTYLQTHMLTHTHKMSFIEYVHTRYIQIHHVREVMFF